MAERNDTHAQQSSGAPPPNEGTTPAATETLSAAVAQAPAASSQVDAGLRERISALERETKALGSDPSAALLFHEIGLLYEELKNPRSAAVAYQNAYRLAPRLLPNLRAARRLFADVGNWQMVIQLMDAELAATEDPAGRAALLFEKAQCLQKRLSREEDAFRVYRQVLELRPTDVGLLQQLEAVYLDHEDHAAVVEVDRLLAEGLDDPSLRAHYLTHAGYLLEDRLRRPEDAATLYRQAFELDRRDPLLLSAIIRISQREDRPEELLQALVAEADALGGQAAPTYLRISKVYAQLGRQEDAVAALLAARRVHPKEALILAELAAIYESEGRHEDLADVLSSWASALTDEREAVALHLRLAALYEEELRRDEDAISRYRAVLDRAPDHPAALAGLGKLYHRTQNWQGLLGVFDLELSTLDDPRQKAAKLYKAAEIEERVGAQEAAIARYNLALQLQPGYLPAQQALIRVYERQGRYADLIAMYEQDLQQIENTDQSLATLTKIASLYEERLGDLDHAIGAIQRILELQSDNLQALRNLSRLFEKAGRFQDFIQTQEIEAGLVSDTKQVLALQHKNAEVLEEQLKDLPGAITTYERLLSLSPSYLPALKALGRLYAQDGRWDELIRMYRAEAEVAPSSEQAAGLLFKIGELYERKVKAPAEAIAAYQEVLTLAPGSVPALRALARLHRASGSWKALIEVLRAEAAIRTDAQERANALFQAAAIWEEKLEKPENALETYQEILRLAPAHTAALRALERIHTAKGDARELAAILEREAQSAVVPAAKIAAYSKLVQLYLDRLNEPARAAQCCEAILLLEPTHLNALRTLERLRASDKLRRAELRRRMADQIPDERLRAALRFSVATESEGPAATRIEALEQTLAEGTLDARVGFSLDRAFRSAQHPFGLAQLLQKQIAATQDPTEQLLLWVQLGDLYEARLSDLEASRDAFAQALQLNPDFLPALQGASRVALKLGDYASACAALEREGSSCKDLQSSLRAFTQAGRIAADSLNDGEKAIALFRRALERDPLNPAASAGLEELLASRGGESDLAVLQERRGEAKLSARDASAAAADFFAAAQRWRTIVKDDERAMAAVDRALAAEPGLIPALEMKGELCEAAGKYPEAAAALALRVQQGGEARALSTIHLKLGALYQEHLGDGTRAAAHLQTALAADASNSEALDRLAKIHIESRNWTGAADCLRRLLELETRAEPLARHTLELARVVDEGFGDPVQAAALYKRALDLNPNDGAIVDRLAALYERTRNIPELIQVLEQQASRSHELKRTLALRLRIAHFYATSLNELPRAVGTYRNVLDLDAENLDAHAALADIYSRDAASAPMAIEEHRTLLRLDPTRIDSLHALFRIWEGQRQTDRAFAVACALQFFRAANDAEAAFYAEHKQRVAQDGTGRLSEPELDLLMHPAVRGGLVDVLKLIGDQLTKVYPPDFEGLGIDRKADRLKPDHVVFKAIRNIAQVFGVEELEVYQAHRGLMTLETTEPLAVCVGQEVVRKFNAREQKFLIGRAVHGLLLKTAVLFRLTMRERAQLLGSAVRVGDPSFAGLGSRDEAQEKQLRKALSRKVLKALEQTAPSVRRDVDVDRTVAGLACSADRAGLLMSGDILMGLNMLLRQDSGFTSVVRGEGGQQVIHAVRTRDDIRELLTFALSDDFFRLRQTVGLALPS